MIPYGVASQVELRDRRAIRSGGLAEDEERRRHPLIPQNAQESRVVPAIRAVIEGQVDDLVRA
jgi:hypothetical protein